MRNGRCHTSHSTLAPEPNAQAQAHKHFIPSTTSIPSRNHSRQRAAIPATVVVVIAAQLVVRPIGRPERKRNVNQWYARPCPASSRTLNRALQATCQLDARPCRACRLGARGVDPSRSCRSKSRLQLAPARLPSRMYYCVHC